jgi:hypothetical protein
MGRQLPFGSGEVGMFPLTRIHPVTGRPSLFPASYTRIPDSTPCGFACPTVPGRKYGFSAFRVFDN